MTLRKRMAVALLLVLSSSAVIYGVTVSMRPVTPPIVIGPYKFWVMAVSDERMKLVDRRLPAEQVWITLEVDPSDPNMQVRNLHAYLPRLLENIEMVGPDGSRQKPFWSQPLTAVAWYDSIRKIGRASHLQMRFGFDNTAHWKTATLTAHFDSSKWRMADPEELSVSGMTLRFASINLP